MFKYIKERGNNIVVLGKKNLTIENLQKLVLFLTQLVVLLKHLGKIKIGDKAPQERKQLSDNRTNGTGRNSGS